MPMVRACVTVCGLAWAGAVGSAQQVAKDETTSSRRATGGGAIADGVMAVVMKQEEQQLRNALTAKPGGTQPFTL